VVVVGAEVLVLDVVVDGTLPKVTVLDGALVARSTRVGRSPPATSSTSRAVMDRAVRA